MEGGMEAGMEGVISAREGMGGLSSLKPMGVQRAATCMQRPEGGGTHRKDPRQLPGIP